MDDLKDFKKEQKIYYPALDGLRFFAFFSVFLHHTLQSFDSKNPIANYFLMIFKKNGWVGVDLFFVLSGFLITTLLLEERRVYGKFSLKNFYIRRSLRIWPLYFLALILGFFIFPFLSIILLNTNYSDPRFIHELQYEAPLYFSFLGNWAVVFNGYSSFTKIAHLWTISIEEQFYILWPLVLILIRNLKTALVVSTLFILGPLLYRAYLANLDVQHPGIYTNTFARIDILSIGSLIALVLFYKKGSFNKLKFALNLPLQLFLLICLSFILYRVSLFNPYLIKNGIFGYLIIGSFMAYFTLSALNTNSFFSKFLSQKYLVWLGKLSYGLYVWHILAIEITNYFIRQPQIRILFPIVAFILTVIFTSISYYFFEVHFLKLKKKFTKIGSRSV